MRDQTVETLVGVVVVAVAASFISYAALVSDRGAAVKGYELIGRFPAASGVAPGTEVRISGVKVGAVVDVTLDPKTYFADVRLTMREDIALASDTSAKITADGLLSESYIAIEPGGDFEDLKPGDIIANTQGTVDLLGLLSTFAPDGS